MFRRHAVLTGVCGYLLAWLAMNVFVVAGVQRESIRIEGPKGETCLATAWLPPEPKAVIVVGHGVTANRGVMAAMSNTFARNGYAAIAIDFWGHGRSRERFDWTSNAAQVNAWCDWARGRFPGLPLAYLGHSMGGDAGGRAFRDKANVDAFVSMGMLPRKTPACKTLLAFGRFEELFSSETAWGMAHDGIEALESPYSNHLAEAVDPVLLQGIVGWIDKAFGFDDRVVFPWFRWLAICLAPIVGMLASLTLAGQATSVFARRLKPREMPVSAPPGRFNVFRIAARALRCSGEAKPPRTDSLRGAIFAGTVFAAVFVVLFSWVLTTNVYTCRLDHPERCLMWLVLGLIMALLFSLTARALERISLHTTFQRFAVGALTRAVPLLAMGLALELAGPGIAFCGMMLCIFALVFVLIAAIYALATRSAGDYKAGVAACGIVLAWITAFWFPLLWT